mmetsp:Transcript_27456/g.27333  ORF Transcript_27456/g.27333 Transcript_27456/m.27333 type:complete len:111 (-) Transcript_27456:117-449(-)
MNSAVWFRQADEFHGIMFREACAQPLQENESQSEIRTNMDLAVILVLILTELVDIATLIINVLSAILGMISLIQAKVVLECAEMESKKTILENNEMMEMIAKMMAAVQLD